MKSWEIRRVGETGSTNSDLRRLAEAGQRGPLVLAADHQTHGRGRRDRRWVSPPGENLLVSVLLTPDPAGCAVGDFGWLTQMAALAVCDVCAEFTGVPAQLKWPNDVLVDGCKLAGVLAEVVSGAGSDSSIDQTSIIVGIGVNVNWPSGSETDSAESSLSSDVQLDPDTLLIPPTSLARIQFLKSSKSPPEKVDRNAVLDVLLASFKQQVDAVGQPGWQQQTRARVKKISATLGQQIRVKTAQNLTGTTGRTATQPSAAAPNPTRAPAVIAGEAVDIDASGALVLRPDDDSLGDTITILAGDVTAAGFQTPASP